MSRRIRDGQEQTTYYEDLETIVTQFKRLLDRSLKELDRKTRLYEQDPDIGDNAFLYTITTDAGKRIVDMTNTYWKSLSELRKQGEKAMKVDRWSHHDWSQFVTIYLEQILPHIDEVRLLREVVTRGLVEEHRLRELVLQRVERSTETRRDIERAERGEPSTYALPEDPTTDSPDTAGDPS